MATLPSNVVLFSVRNSRSSRIAWILEELSLSYTVVEGFETANYTLDADFTAKVGCLGRTPTIHDLIKNDEGEQEKIIIQESGAIAEYLLTRYDSTYRLHFPKCTINSIRVNEYIHLAEGTYLFHIAPIMYCEVVFSRIIAKHLETETEKQHRAGIVDEIYNVLKDKVDVDLDWLEKQLRQEKQKLGSAGDSKTCGLYLVGGRFSVADIMMGYALDLIFTRGLRPEHVNLDRWSYIRDWLTGLRARKQYQAGLTHLEKASN